MSSKLESARRRLAEVAAIAPTGVIVAVSGGKDSLVTVDLCIRQYGAERVQAFYMYLVDGIECVERYVRAATTSRGVTLHKVPHWDLPRMLKQAVLRPHLSGAEQLRETKLVDVESLVRARTGLEWVASGNRAESYGRAKFAAQADGVHQQWRRVWPIWDWSPADVFAYLRSRHIAPPPTSGVLSWGVALDPQTLAWMRMHHPSDYAKIIAVFPYADLAQDPRATKRAPRRERAQ